MPVNKVSPKLLALALFFFAVLLRFILCSKGGQFFIIDETRFYNGHYLLSHLSDLDILAALNLISSSVAHTFFIFFAALAEGVRYVVVIFFEGFVPPYFLTQSDIGIEYAAFTLSFASSFNVVLVYLIIIKLGGSTYQALVGAFLLFVSNTNFYFSRHLLPYDCATMLALMGFYLSCKFPISIKGSIYCGLFSGLATLTYNGYWPLSFVLWMSHLLFNGGDYKKITKLGFISFVSGIFPLVILQIISLIVDQNFLSGLLVWLKATKLNQMGNFGIGWKVLFTYLWSSEGVIMIIYIIGLVLSFIFLNKSTKWKLDNVSAGPFMVVVTLSILLFFSDFLQSSVLYGRTIKQIVPLLCIAGSFPFTFLLAKCSRLKNGFSWSVLVITTTCFFATQNYHSTMEVVYPKCFKKNILNGYTTLSQLSEIKGPKVSKLESPEPSADLLLINCQTLIPPLVERILIPHGKAIASELHPYKSFTPYQYIHYNRNERILIDSFDLDMKLVERLEL